MNMIGRNNDTLEAYPKQITATISRRAFLRTSGALTVTAIGLSSAWNPFAEAGPAITPFTYHAPQSALDDLRRRLALTRWRERQTVRDWSQGVPLAKLRTLVQYWQTVYDWRRGRGC
jgi:epoxide hydrolase